MLARRSLGQMLAPARAQGDQYELKVLTVRHPAALFFYFLTDVPVPTDNRSVRLARREQNFRGEYPFCMASKGRRRGEA
jgi:hypothetical protein